MGNRNVVVTGMGAVSPYGVGVDRLWDGLISKKSGIKVIDTFDTEGMKSKIAGLCKDFNPEDYIGKKSEESRIITQIDKLEMAFQALDYDSEENNELYSEFFLSVEDKLIEPKLKEIFNFLKSQRYIKE